MPTLKKRGSFWHIGIRINGKYKFKSTGFRNKSEALKVMIGSGNRSYPALTLSGLLNIVNSDRSKKPSTIEQFKYPFAHLMRFLGDRLISSITPRDIDEFKSKRIDDGATPETINGNMSKIRAAFGVAKKYGYIKDNPASSFGKLKIGDSIRCIDDEQFEAFLGKCPEAWKPVFTLGYKFGLRRHELVNVKWSMLLPDRLILPASITKTEAERHIPRTAEMDGIIETSPRVCEYIFSIRGKQIKEERITHRFKSISIKAKLPGEIHLHSLRHSCATNMLNAGYSLTTVQYILGHKSIVTTNKYVHPGFASAQRELMTGSKLAQSTHPPKE